MIIRNFYANYISMNSDSQGIGFLESRP